MRPNCAACRTNPQRFKHNELHKIQNNQRKKKSKKNYFAFFSVICIINPRPLTKDDQPETGPAKIKAHPEKPLIFCSADAYCQDAVRSA